MTGEAQGLNLGRGLRFPREVLGRKIGVYGMTGSGKSSTGIVLAEEASAAGVIPVIFDPTGAWVGIRTSANGKGPGVPVVVFGGDHGDVPLEPESGRFIARLVAERKVPGVLIDASGLTPSDQRRLGFELFDELLHLNRHPVLLIVDEAHRFAPRNAPNTERGGYGAKCHHALVEAVTVGRRKGIGVALIVTRPSKLATDAREMLDVLIVHQLRGTNDRKSVAEWVEDEDDDSAQWLAELPKFPVGRALVSAPKEGVAGVFAIRKKRTYDTSYSPIDEGRALEIPAARASVDLEEVRKEMADAIERAAEQDPERLRERIRELEGMVKGASTGTAVDAERVAELEQDLAAAGERQRQLEERAEQLERLAHPAPAFSDGYRAAIADVSMAGADASDSTEALACVAAAVSMDALDVHAQHALYSWQAENAPERPPAPPKPPPAPAQPIREVPGLTVDDIFDGGQNGHGEVLPAGSLRQLEALARYVSLTRSELEVLGVSAGGAFRRNLAPLMAGGYVEEVDGRLRLTAQGHRRAGTPGGPWTTDEVLAKHLPKLPSGSKRILDVVLRSPDRGFTRSELEGLAKSKGGAFRRNLAPLKRKHLVEERNRRIFPGHVLYAEQIAERAR